MSEINEAIRILRAGGLVAFPTETVYGLGADATNAGAVRQIFAAKGRPATNPLIAHVADEATARRYAQTWPAAAARLAARFWPGPLSLVVPKITSIVDEATAGRQTVALRSPDHPLALQLLREFGGALVAPSANRSTRVSPTTAQHVRDELGNAVDLILDGGSSQVGIESTVLDLCQAQPVILRPGSITRQQIESEIGPVREQMGSIDPSIPAASPGQHEIHYAPATPATWFAKGQLARSLPAPAGGSLPRIALICIDDAEADARFEWSAKMPASPDDYARELYATLRTADRLGVDLILIEMPPNDSRWTAVRDRLQRASKPLH